MQLRGCAVTFNIVAIYCNEYYKRSVGKAKGVYSKFAGFEPTVHQYLSSNNVRLSTYVFTGEDL